MFSLGGKKIIVGISAGIAAYKTTFLVRSLIKAGAEVKVVMTPAAKEFVSPLVLSTLSKHPVIVSFLKEEASEISWNNHIDLAIWADLMVVAPLTANTLSKIVSGGCDHFMMAVILSLKCDLMIAPAMDLDMYKHPSTQKNLNLLKERGVLVLPSPKGELASGLIGEGRMSEPEEIESHIKNYFNASLPLKGKRVLVTAGPTYEAIDPVRFIGNHSSGLMGFEIAKSALRNGAEVVLVSGPTHLQIEKDPNLTLVKVISTDQMANSCFDYFDRIDIFIGAAAVSDYKPTVVANQKIKKKEALLSLPLEPTIDILETLGRRKKDQYLVGFALETEEEEPNAILKIQKKNLDLIVLNSLKDKGAGFKVKTNKVAFIDRSFVIENQPLKLKSEVADDLINKIIQSHGK